MMPPMPPTTPPPMYAPNVLVPHPSAAPARMTADVKGLLRAAAYRGQRLYPGPIGELIVRELLAVEEFGWVLGADALATRLARHIMGLPAAASPPTAAAGPNEADAASKP